MNVPKSRPAAVEKAPGTFSHRNHLGLISATSRTRCMTSPLRMSASPPLFPAIENPWQGVPPTRRSTDPRKTSPLILVMSPRFGTSGKWCARTEQGKGSISEKAIGFHPSPFHAALAASIPLQSERYLITTLWPFHSAPCGTSCVMGITARAASQVWPFFAASPHRRHCTRPAPARMRP